MTGWTPDRALPRWPRPSPDEPPQLWTAEWQDENGKWQLLIEDVSLRLALAESRRFRERYPDAETRVR